MPFIKISYGSSRNIGVQGVDHLEVDPKDLDSDGNVPSSVLDSAWQDAVNEFMDDTHVEVVEREGD